MRFHIPLSRRTAGFFLLLEIFVTPALGLIQKFECPTFIGEILDGLSEASMVADSVSKVLETFDSSVPYSNTTSDPRLAIYGPILNPGDKSKLKGYLDAMANITVSHEIELGVYCTSDPIIKKMSPVDHRQYWWDIDFHDNNTTGPVSLPVLDAQLPSPAEKTFTKLGYNAGVEQNATGQAHIFISPKILNLSEDDVKVDTRRLVDIRDNGLKPDKNFNHIDFIRPLSRSIMRELFIVVGGLIDPNQNMTTVVDVPGKNTNISMFSDCLMQKNGSPASIITAECLTTVTTGLFLQIHNRPTFWSTGVVNRDTLQAEDPDGSFPEDTNLY